MDFGKYIHQLLLENEVVIIPGFGAFVSEYKPAEISEDNDEIKPPSKIISFNQQLRNNDGLLVGYVAEKRRSSHFDALKKIEQEREDMLYKLDNGEKVELSDVGVLFYTDEHKIGFTAVEDENLLLDSFGLDATAISDEEPDEPVESVPEIVPETENLEETEAESDLIPEPAELEDDIEPAEEEEEPEELEEEPVPVMASDTLEKEADVWEPKYRMAEPMPEEEKKKRGWWWLLLILIPLIAVSVFIFMKGKNDGPRGTDSGQKPQTIEIQESITWQQPDSATVDSVVLSSQDSVVKADTTPEPTIELEPETPKYYLVSGSFSVEENAQTYINELKAKGVDAFPAGKKGRFFIVGIGTYNSFREAEIAKQEYLISNPGSEVWVWKK